MVENKFLWILLALLMCIVVLQTSAQQFYPTRYGKRDELGPGGGQRFHTGSRYGRSQGQVEVTARNDRFFLGSRYGKRAPDTPVQGSRCGRSSGQVEVTARNDRFFLGSRYGKRASEPDAEDESLPKTVEDSGSHVTCTYTGVSNLYRCFSKTDSDLDLNINTF